MNEVVKKVVIAGVFFILGIVAVLLFRSRQSSADPNKKIYEDSIQVLQNRFDSLQNIANNAGINANKLKQQIDSLQAGDSSFKNTIAEQTKKLQDFKPKYAKNIYIDTISRADILRYVADSLPTEGH